MANTLVIQGGREIRLYALKPSCQSCGWCFVIISGFTLLFRQRLQRADVLLDTGVNFHISVLPSFRPSILPSAPNMHVSHWITWKIDKKLKKNENFQMCPLRTYGNSPLCPTGHRPFGAAALKAWSNFTHLSQNQLKGGESAQSVKKFLCQDLGPYRYTSQVKKPYQVKVSKWAIWKSDCRFRIAAKKLLNEYILPFFTFYQVGWEINPVPFQSQP